MAISLLLVWSGGSGVAFPSPSNAPKLAQSLHWKEDKEGMECCSFLFALGYLERKK